MADSDPKSGNYVPPFIDELIATHSVESMAPGEVTWTESYNLATNAEREIFINSEPRRFRRNEGPGQKLFGPNVKVIKDFEGVYLDLTALSDDDLASALSQSPYIEVEISEDESRYVSVAGVLFPNLEEESGLEPDRLQAFNREQAEKQRHFASYYRMMYDQEYHFARDEKPPTDDLLGERAEAKPQRRRPRGIDAVLRYFGL